MPVNLIKLCVGARTVDDLRQWQDGRLADDGRIYHRTRHMPKRGSELLAGGSLFWVIRGFVQVRQRVLGLDREAYDDGSRCCVILLDRDLVPVMPQNREPFQGWRYLEEEAAPTDLSGIGAAAQPAGFGEPPLEMMLELKALGLI